MCAVECLAGDPVLCTSLQVFLRFSSVAFDIFSPVLCLFRPRLVRCRIPCLLHHGLSSPCVFAGGVAPHVTELAAGLARRGNQVHLFVRAGPDMSQPSYQCIDEVHVHRVPIELNPDFVTECNNMCNAQVWYIRETERYMRTTFDVVHAHDWLCGKTIVQMKQAGRNTVFTCHSTEFGRAGRTELDHVSLRIQAIEAEVLVEASIRASANAVADVATRGGEGRWGGIVSVIGKCGGAASCGVSRCITVASPQL